jgi:predicted transposase YdaD
LFCKIASIFVGRGRSGAKKADEAEVSGPLNNRLRQFHAAIPPPGKAEGAREGRIEVARNMLRLGLPAETVAEAAGLSREEVLGLSN